MTDARYAREPRIRVAAVIIRDNSLLLAEHHKDNQTYYLLPGGGVNKGETLYDALVRELWEETRLKVQPGRLLFLIESIAPDASRHVIQLAFAATIEDNAEPSKGEDPRVISASFFPAEKLPKLPMFPPLQKTLYNGVLHGFPDIPQSLGNRWKMK